MVGLCLAGIPTVSETGVRYGWTVGAGLAYAIDSTWSAFADYGYYSFNRHTYRFTAPDGAINVGHAQHLLRFGLNYRFGDGLGYNPASVAVPEVVNDVTGEFGTRVGYSTGKFRKRLYDNVTPGQLNSVLTWPTRNDAAVEAFARVDHSSGLFLRGTIGGLDLGRSRMHDEDTAVVMAPFPYSDTVSQMKNGRAFSATVDLGYTAVKTSLVTLGAFAGYGFYAQRLNGYGCEQVAGSIVCAPAGTVSPTALTLSETERWSMLRLGLAGSLMITDKLKLTAEGAWLGRATLAAKDNHWLRPNINPLIESGRQGGKGFETEVGLSYALGPRWSVGAGVRYMMLKANGGVTFPGSPTLSPEKFETRRMTTFFQASYRFGDQTTPAPAAVVARY